MTIQWTNPYASLNGTWLKGNLHAHTTPRSPCGRVPLARVLALYEESGFDFLAISDHPGCTPVDVPTKLITIACAEWNSRTENQDRMDVTYYDHMGIYSLHSEVVEGALAHKARREVLDALRGEDVLVILNHPNWRVPHHHTDEALFQMYKDASGMEIYNAVVEHHPGVADSTMKWDRVLTDKGPFLGFASDDSHLEEDINKAWIMVSAGDRTAAAFYDGIKAGRFYCTTGVTIRQIGREGDEVYCSAGKEIHIDVIGENGQVLLSSSMVHESWYASSSF